MAMTEPNYELNKKFMISIELRKSLRFIISNFKSLKGVFSDGENFLGSWCKFMLKN